MTDQTVRVERDGAVAIVTIDRPQVRNALDAATLSRLDETLAALAADAGVRAVVVTGGGDKAFVAGADIRELAALAPADAREHARRGQAVFDRVERLGKPVIAAINGYALGGGCELAMACTLRIAVSTARIGLPEITLGLLPGYAGTQRLVRLVGKGRALEMMLTGTPVDAATAERIGLVNRVVPAGELLRESRALATDLAARAPLATRFILDAASRGLEMPFEDACAFEAALFGLAAATEDMREGTRAFLEKRQARFQGR